MKRIASLLILLMAMASPAGAARRSMVVADSLTHSPLPNATVYDRTGAALCMSDDLGRLPRIAAQHYPLTVRYIGFNEARVIGDYADTVFLSEAVAELPEFVVETRSRRLLHILAYVREVSTLTTYTDTVYMFREKMVDFMLRPDKSVGYAGWTNPRTLTCRSYYRFTDAAGLDSVSDASDYHFSWADWMSVPPPARLPLPLKGRTTAAADTLHAKYSAMEIWRRDADRVGLSVNVLADNAARRWVPELTPFFSYGVEFDRLRLDYTFDNVTADSISPMELSRYSFAVESTGRGRTMFRFGKRDQEFFVSTEADVYIMDREYVSVGEAKKWAARRFDLDEIGIYEPMDAPPLADDVRRLMARVEGIDKDAVRLGARADTRMISKKLGRRNFRIGRRALLMLKGLTGISAYKGSKKRKQEWKEFRDQCRTLSGSGDE